MFTSENLDRVPLLKSESTKLSVTWEEEGCYNGNYGTGTPPCVPLAKRTLQRLMSNPRDELQRFRISLFWMGLDQSTPARVVCSWVIFILFTLIVPLINGLAVTCTKCDTNDFPFERLGYISESALSIVSFTCLSYLLRVYGLRKVLLLEKLERESQDVQQGYKAKVNNAFLMLSTILLPSLLVKLAHEIWWFEYVSINLPFIPQCTPLKAVMCLTLMVSWLYKTSVFLLMCVLFRLMCSLQILRLQGYNKLLEESLEAPMILLEHVRIRKQLFKISHRCRLFVVGSMLIITTSQFVSLFFILSYKDRVHFFRAGSLAVCSAVQLCGFLICMNGASKITHRAQKIVSLVSEWHAVWTCSTMTTSFNRNRNPPIKAPPPCYPLVRTQSDISTHEVFSVKTEESNYDKECYYKQQQALLTYLQHNTAGVSVYGFVLDRGFLYTLFALELSLVLWILGKTVTSIH